MNTPNFPENCMKSKEFGRPGGACVPHAPPRSANANFIPRCAAGYRGDRCDQKVTSGGSGGDSDDITLLDWILIACLGALAVFCLFGCGMLYSKTKDYHLRHTENYAQLRDWITEIR